MFQYKDYDTVWIGNLNFKFEETNIKHRRIRVLQIIVNLGPVCFLMDYII